MKLFKYLLIIILFVFPACDVHRIPETETSDDSFWFNDTDLRYATTYLYTFLPDFLNIDDAMSDFAFDQRINDVSTGARLAPVKSEDYELPYKCIRASNNIIEKAPRAIDNGTDPQIVDRYIAEARFFRAFAYFSLVQKYGGVTLLLRVPPVDAPELFEPASPREEIYKVIYEDLDFAIEKLAFPSTMNNADWGRISKTAALAFKARVALFEGTRAKYHQYGDPNKHLTLAVSAAESVIESNEHSLFGNYFNLFQPEGEGRQNKENVFVKRHGIDQGNRVVLYKNSPITVIDQGWTAPTKAMIDTYLMKDGLPIDKSPLYLDPSDAPQDSSNAYGFLEIFKNRDLRMDASVFKPGDNYLTGVNDPEPIPYRVANIGWVKTGFTQRKFFNTKDWVTLTVFQDYPIIRYAEVLLIFAEAKFELNGNITDEELDLSINLLRERGGIPPLSNSFITSNNLDMLEEIRRERSVELASEGFRYWDIIRWKTAETVLPKSILGSYFYEEYYGNVVDVNLTPDNYILVQDASSRKFDPQKDYLWPIPINELALNVNLKQNPGW